MQKEKILKNIILTLLTFLSCYYSKWSFLLLLPKSYTPKGFTKGLLYSKDLQKIFYPCVITLSLFTNLEENANIIKGLKNQVGISLILNLLGCPCEVTYGCLLHGKSRLHSDLYMSTLVINLNPNEVSFNEVYWFWRRNRLCTFLVV